MNPPSSPAVEARGLVRVFGEKRAVDGVDLDIPRGQIYGFLGPNGAGKSTTVRMLTTLLNPTSGTARVAGHDIAGDTENVRLRIGVALQESALDPKQTGREILDMQGRLYGLDRAARNERIASSSSANMIRAIVPRSPVLFRAATRSATKDAAPHDH